jgi:hypothetical protein
MRSPGLHEAQFSETCVLLRLLVGTKRARLSLVGRSLGLLPAGLEWTPDIGPG